MKLEEKAVLDQLEDCFSKEVNFPLSNEKIIKWLGKKNLIGKSSQNIPRAKPYVNLSKKELKRRKKIIRALDTIKKKTSLFD